MPRFDISTSEGLVAACRKAEHLIDPDWVAQSAGFLERVHRTPKSEQDSEGFLRLVWETKLLANLGGGDYPMDDAFSNRNFRQYVRDLPSSESLGGSAERAARLDDIFMETLDRAKQFVRPNKNGSRDRPWIKTQRALAALYRMTSRPFSSGKTATIFFSSWVKNVGPKESFPLKQIGGS